MMEEKAARRMELARVINGMQEILLHRGWRQIHTPEEVMTMRKALQLLYDYEELCGEEEECTKQPKKNTKKQSKEPKKTLKAKN